MTHRLKRAVRYPIVIAIGTSVMLVLAGSHLVAPGPPEVLIEPQTGMTLVAIEPGRFDMGSQPNEPGRGDDETVHPVTLTRRFFMGRFEVTQTEWAVVMNSRPSHFSDCGRCPVENVDFFEVDEFITKLNAQSTSMRYRLPTEAEWEYACRAGSTTPFANGDRLTGPDANIDGRFPYPEGPAGVARDRTVPVASFAPNAFGLYDMHGNVWEWTNDWYGPYNLRDDVNPRGPAAGTRRVIRGGSWHFDGNSARCGLRYTHAPQDRGYSLGFRIVAEPVSRRRDNKSLPDGGNNSRSDFPGGS